MTYLVQAPYTTITPNLAAGSDPSRGPVGNPIVLRRGQVLQNLIHRSTQSQGSLVPEPASPSLSDCQVVITVDSTTYPDPTANPGDEFFEADIIQVGSYQLRAGYEFGVGEGRGTGVVGDVATSLGTAIANLRIPDILSVVVQADQVGLLLRAPSLFEVKAMSLSGALALFAVNFTLSTAPRQVANLTGSVVQAAPFV